MVDPIPLTNDFLKHLSESQRLMIIKRCKQITLDCGEELYSVSMPIKQVYFPITGFISLKTETIDHKHIEVLLIGCEGMLGASLALGNKCAPMTSKIVGSGSALSMDTDLFEDLLARHTQIRKLALNYIYVLMQQLTQTSACHQFHLVKQRLAHCLLATQDRVDGNKLYLTHDCLANMLGVRRSAITIAAGLLMQHGAISYGRGTIVVLSREALERESCACYRHAINAHNKVMSEL